MATEVMSVSSEMMGMEADSTIEMVNLTTETVNICEEYGRQICTLEKVDEKTNTSTISYYSVDLLIEYIKYSEVEPVELALSDVDYSITDEKWAEGQAAISAKDVFCNKKKYAEHLERIIYANITSPIIVTEDGVIIDGCHRMAHAYWFNYETIPAHIISMPFLEQFRVESPEPSHDDLTAIIRRFANL